MDPQKDIRIICDTVKTASCSACNRPIDVAGREPFTAVTCAHCGHEETVPAQFGQFLLLNLLSSGGMGGVYRARDLNLGRLVAIKVMRTSLGEDAEFVEQFKREAQAAAQLNHPNVAQIYTFGQEKGQPFIAMEFVAGRKFDKLIETSKDGMDQAFVLRVGIEIAEGLQAADEIGLIHGDIKPGNILLDEKTHAKLVDFGIATYAGRQQGEGVWGTPYYIAPERVQKQKIDARSDIYSLGATLFHALAGRPPFEGDTPAEVVAARLRQDAPKLHLYRSDINDKVEATIDRMLQTYAARRYPNYSSLISDLTAASDAVCGVKGEKARPGAKMVRLQFKKKPPLAVAATSEPLEEGDDSPVRIVVPRAAMPRITGLTEQAQQRNAAEAASHAVRIRRALLILLALLLLAAGGAGGLFAYRKFTLKQSATFEVRRQALALKQEQGKAADLLVRVQRTASEIGKTAELVWPVVTRATNILFAVLGEAPAEPAPEAPPPPAPGATNAPARAAAVTNAPAPAAPGATNAPARATAVTNAPAPAAPATTNAPPPAQSTATNAPSPVPGPADASPEAAESAKLREAANAAYAAGRRVQALAEKARSSSAAATKANEEAAKATAAADVTPRVEQIGGLLQTIRQTQSQVLPLIKEAQKALETVQRQRTVILELRKAQAGEEERKRKEEAQKALVAEETARAALLPGTVDQLFKQFRFEEAAQTLSRQLSSYKTEEGKRAAAVVAERYRLGAELFAYLIQQLSAAPLRWGWERSRGVSEDILGADKEGVKLRDRVVPWPKVSQGQLVRFVDRFVVLEKAGSPTKQARLFLGAAMFFRETGSPALAKRYVEKAVAAAPHMQAEAIRLVPVE
jgi:predicted Ser/Thr protein kinase